MKSYYSGLHMIATADFGVRRLVAAFGVSYSRFRLTKSGDKSPHSKGFMPSGNTHDLITFLLAAPTAAMTYYFTNDWMLTAIATAAMLFGGLMFGPDLDIQSRQYTRWGPLRFLWWPYKVVLRHRSRWSHSIMLGTLVRIIYFLAVVTIILAVSLYIREAYIHRAAAGLGRSRKRLAACGRLSRR